MTAACQSGTSAELGHVRAGDGVSGDWVVPRLHAAGLIMCGAGGHGIANMFAMQTRHEHRRAFPVISPPSRQQQHHHHLNSSQSPSDNRISRGPGHRKIVQPTRVRRKGRNTPALLPFPKTRLGVTSTKVSSAQFRFAARSLLPSPTIPAPHMASLPARVV